MPIPEPAEDTVRIVPLGGVEEIGRNMTLVEIGDDIVIIDCGFQFREQDTPGIDYILPNTQYLEERREKIRGMIITHGHLDHIGGIPYVLDRIGNPTIYTRALTGAMIRKRQEEFAYLPPIDIRNVEKDEVIHLGKLTIRFFSVTHTVPDSMGIIIETAWGDVVFTGDIKLNHTDGDPSDEEKKEYGIFKDRTVLALLMDSTNIERAGFSIPEHIVYDTLEEIIKTSHRRLIIGMFASHLERLIRIVYFAEKYNKKVAIDGRSMKTNIEIARELGLIKYKDDTVIPVDFVNEYAPDKVIVLATGAQGDEFASLMRIANKTHRFIRIGPTDTVVLSSSVIPGNERAVQKLKDNLSRQGAHMITYQTSDVHASGHGNREEAIWIHKQIKPKFFIPQHGYHYMLRVHADLAESLGVNGNNIIVPDNSSVIEIQNGGTKIVKRKEKAPAELRVVEGQSIGELRDVLMRDRLALAQEGFCVVVATIDKRTGKLHKSPDIISRGFVYLRDNKELMDQTRLIVRKSVEDAVRTPHGGDLEEARAELAEAVSHFLLQKTQKRPIVIPVIVSV
jgi:ribonuclease J